MPDRFSRIVHLVLIGDCPDERAALRRAFSSSPYLEVLKEIGMDEALAWAVGSFSINSRDRPDLIVLDLPQSDEALKAGCELLRRIKTHAGLQGIPVVLVGEEEILRRLPLWREASCCSIVRKPADAVELRGMAWHFGEYWGAVARVPPRSDVPESREHDRFPTSPLAVDRNVEGMIRRPIDLLVVDDNNDDAVLFQESLASLDEIRLIQILDDPRAGWEYLSKQGRFRDVPTPDLVVLDIHMPQKTGMAFLDDLKGEPSLCRLPVVVLTASRLEEDIWESYSRGASTFVEKPPRFEWFCELAGRFANYWTGIAYLPDRSE